ncbi:Afadin and alpha-actinin-binding-domain-containing protein [Mycena rebaudengoi]|nr:Afadin and alpha-actinin-binding-domain-containing protein [Mycena rebaudengoi]
MAATPKKGVHWGVEDPSFGSPFSDTSSAMLSTSSLDYINSQLVAHGFAPSPGLSLDGLANSNLERVVKCLLGMLSQRVEDMSRTEDLTTKLRTLSYDHERLMTMHRNATEVAANAEREVNLHKSRYTAATRSLQTSESAHKHTLAELQRARTAFQTVRATHQSELKKKEKEVERVMDKWAKLADMQAKLSAASSGMRCANIAVLDGTEVLGKGPGLAELALEQAEDARQRFAQDNAKLRGLLLAAVNEAQAILHQARKSDREDEPTPFTLSTLFPMGSQDAANEKLASLLATLREAATRPATPQQVTPLPPTNVVPDGELARLQGIIDGLRTEIDRSRKESMAQAVETQAMFDQFAKDRRVVGDDIADASVELMIAPVRDAEKERLDGIKRQLDLERNKFTEAALKLGQEKADLEAERIKLLDQKRSWEVEKMLAELPPTPNPPSPLRASTSRKSPRKAPHKSPVKVVTVGKAGTGRKTTRISRRSSLSSPPRVQAAFETEVLPPLPAPAFTSLSSLLPTSFVLPPPSPSSAFPAPSLFLSSGLLDIPPPPQAPPPAPPLASTSGSDPTTPPSFKRPFPMAKPFAARMVHAYSPAKPSPLSRILMLANSPATPAEGDTEDVGNVSTPLEALLEEDEGAPQLVDALFPEVRQLTLAEELGVSESPPESPEVVSQPQSQAKGQSQGTGHGRVFHREPSRFSAQEKGKGRAPETAASGRAKPVGEKENSDTKTRRRNLALPKADANASVKAGSAGSAAAKAASRARLMAKLPAPSASVKTGPRRVLADSAEAATARGWRA